MAMTPTTALLWRQWRETRSILIVFAEIAIALALGFAGNQLSIFQFGAEDLASTQFTALAFFAIMLGIVMAVLQGNERRQSVLFAVEWWTLPISTLRIVVIMLGYRIAVLSVFLTLAFGAQWAASALGGETVGWMADVLTFDTFAVLISIGILAFAMVQTLVWLILPLNAGLMSAISMTPFGGIFAVSYWDWDLESIVRTIAQPAFALPIAAVALPAAGWGALGQRQGRWVSVRSWRLEFGSTRAQQPFQSAEQAHRWYEQRFYARWVAGFGIAASAFLAVLVVLKPNPETNVVGLLFSVLGSGGVLSTGLFLCLLGAFASGIPSLALAMKNMPKKTSMYPFLMPISNERMARARYVAAATSAAVAAACVFLVAVLSAYLGPVSASESDSISNSFAGLLVVGLVVGPLAIWAAYLVGGPVYSAAMIGFSLYTFIQLANPQSAVDTTLSALSVGGVLALTALCILFVGTVLYGARKGFLTRSTLQTMLVAAPIVVVGAVLPALFGVGIGTTWTAVLAVPVVSILVLLYPFIFWPTFLGWVRTR